MCAINPKHQQHFTLSVYTSIAMGDEEFTRLVTEKVLALEQELNVKSDLRWHVGVPTFTRFLCLECERPLTQEEQDGEMLCQHCNGDM